MLLPMMLQSQPQPPLPLPVNKNSRIDLDDLKSQIAKRIGQEQANRYFGYLNGFLAQKLSKHEFNKLCTLTLGHENLILHNKLILAILQNACQAKAPPQVHRDKFLQRSTGFVSKKFHQVDKEVDSSQIPALVKQTWSNGDILQQSSHKFKGGVDNYGKNDWSNHLGVDARTNIAMPQSSIPFNETELGDTHKYNSSGRKRSMQQQQGESHEHLAKRARKEGVSLHYQSSARSKDSEEIVPSEYMENVDHGGELDSFRGPIQAPLGIRFCSASFGGARRTLLSSIIANSDSFSRSFDSGELCDTLVLKKGIEKMAEAQGLDGVTMDCANLLNKGLDAYLKRLIRSCIELRGGVSRKQASPGDLPYATPINGIPTINNIQKQGSAGSLRGAHVSMKDFKTAMELNPPQLGENWTSLLEKICFCSFEE
ncbi:hypothetical protein Cni_G08592 [Canna indica]|uniref:Transcriptional coactivator Hfi1/Transcriptional adapter 1 n=1 Tax=Canna indica TaxID=4628 RepID=A0AAQ3Q823_9LILI|nr:hypothetical protein Cni_G08592 [Canna indica]